MDFRRAAQDLEQQTLLSERALYSESFADFVKAAWPLIEHKFPLIWGWHLELMCVLLERAARREIKRLILNVPPRSLKSIIVSVLFPAWVWATNQSEQFLTLSHDRSLSVRDARKARAVIQSRWYARLFPHVLIVSDQNQKMYYETDKGGHRNAQSFKQGVTGKGGSFILIDDPHDARKIIASDNDRETAVSTYEEAIESRLNRPTEDVMIIIMQRLHDMDLTGWVLKYRKHENWHHCCLPLEYEKDHPFKYPGDPRRKEGECLLDERWPAHIRDGYKRKPLIWNGQYQQRPTIRGGEIFQRTAWQVWTETELPEIRYVIMSVDTAFKEGQENDYTACTVWGMFVRGEVEIKGQEKFDMILLHAWRAKLRFGLMRERVQIEYDKWVKRKLTPDVMLIEDKASGQSLIQELDAAGIPGLFPYNPHNEHHLFRAHLASDILDDGAIWVPGRLMVNGKRDPKILVVWAEDVVNEAESYPRGENDDYVTTCVQAWRYSRDAGFVESSSDHHDPDEEKMINQRANAAPKGAVYG